MTNVNKLKGKIVENNLTIEELSSRMGVNKSTLYRKLGDCGDNFTIKEANSIGRILNLKMDDITSIFFSQFVA
ncbi:MAG: XRE family transcriptional regulator [Eubacteriaceae bacterium]|nr:XRE family transcriptional regulator [Eubacteriaceae bacterium]